MSDNTVRSGPGFLFSSATTTCTPDSDAALAREQRSAALQAAEDKVDAADAEVIANKGPTAASADYARKLMASSQLAQQAFLALDKLIPGSRGKADPATLGAQLPSAKLDAGNEGKGVLSVTGTDGADGITVIDEGDAWEVGALDPTTGDVVSLGVFDKAKVTAINVDGKGGDDALLGFGLDDTATLAGGAGDDRIVSVKLDDTSKGQGPVLSGGDGDDGIFNDRDGAVIDAGAGSNAVVNRGRGALIGQVKGVDSSDFVYNEGAKTSIDYQNAGAQEVHQVASGGSVSVAGSGSYVEVTGRKNAVALGGVASLLDIEGDDNAAVLLGADNVVVGEGANNRLKAAEDDLVDVRSSREQSSLQPRRFS